MKNFTLVFICMFSFCLKGIFAQDSCTFEINNDGFEYSLEVDIDLRDAVFTQNGTTCNATIASDYVYDLQVISAPFGPIFFINVTVDCGASNGGITQTINLANTSGMLSFGSFDFQNTDCSTLVVDCTVAVTTQGGGGLNENNSPCGTITSACARSIF